MKIAYIVPGFCADEADWCIPVLTNFVREISQHVEAVLYTPFPARRGSARLHGVTVQYFREGALKGPARLVYWRALQRSIAHEHRSSPFDLVHAFWATEPGYLATRVSGDLKIPAVVSLAGGELASFEDLDYGAQRTKRGQWLVRHALDGATLLTAGSSWLAEKIPDVYENKTVVLPLGVDTAMFPPGKVRTGHRLLSAASLIPLKDYPTLLKAVAMARSVMPELELRIAGDGVQREELQHKALEFGLYGSMRFRGIMPFEQMPALYNRCDLLVHSSQYEAQGMVVLEALATGMPVVSSKVGIAASMPDALVHTFPPGDAEAMARAIVRSLADREHATLAHEAGPQLIGKHFSTSAVAERFLEMYHDIINND